MGRHRTGDRETQGFETHRCPPRPEGASLRRYEGPRSAEGWVLAVAAIDEWGEHCLRGACLVEYCPFCGERL